MSKETRFKVKMHQNTQPDRVKQEDLSEEKDKVTKKEPFALG